MNLPCIISLKIRKILYMAVYVQDSSYLFEETTPASDDILRTYGYEVND